MRKAVAIIIAAVAIAAVAVPVAGLLGMSGPLPGMEGETGSGGSEGADGLLGMPQAMLDMADEINSADKEGVEGMMLQHPAAVAFVQKHPVFEQALYDLGMDYEFEMIADDGVSSLRINQAKSTGDAYATYNCEFPDGTPYAAEGSDIADRIPGLCL